MLTEKQQKKSQVKLINMNILQVRKYYHLTIEEHGKELVNVFTEKGKQSIPADKPKNIL